MMVPLVLDPPPILRLCIALLTVDEGRLLLDIGWFEGVGMSMKIVQEILVQEQDKSDSKQY